MNELDPMLTWTFVEEIATPDNLKGMFVEGETAVASYKTIRDTATITNKRIIVCDKQGLTGKKVEIYSLPFKSINMYSSENAGKLLDFNAELELWTRAGKIKLNLKKGIDIRKLDKIIAEAIL